ncbi:UNC-like C-terminal-domain-containing protein [Panaeolus papilionaceus]|nr:UNC-like C-terminal-domain-containing protein [Panaeolus papilionaceus]
MLSLLPTTLIALLLSLPAFAEPVTPNDALRHLALQAPKPVEHPICCLKPLTPLEPMDDEILLSFEEWKKKQFVLQTEAPENKGGTATPPISTELGTGTEANSDGEAVIIPSGANASGSPTPAQASGQWAGLSPHFRVPLTDRFNYASLDCSARVHMSHRSAKSASSILSSKKDRYMLSPCNTRNEKQFVVVELCDDIRIDTVQLANFEFFSGVFKDFTVSVARTYSTDKDGWTIVGTYRAKNIRGVQSFHPPTSLHDFYRYLRIDFESHYGSEYYCPISLLRVYGLTHLEQWKWDIWEAESRAKAEYESQLRHALPAEGTVDTPVFSSVVITTPPVGHIPVNDQNISNSIEGQPHVQADKGDNSDSVTSASSHSTDSNLVPTPDTNQQPPPPSDSIHDHVEPNNPPDQQSETTPPPEPSGRHSTDTFASSSAQATSPETPIHSQTPPVISPSSSINLSIKPSPSSENVSSPSPHANPNTPDGSIIITSAPITVPPSPPPTPTIILTSGSPSISVIPIIQSSIVPTSKGGESIYRTIMNRLTAVESNHTLYSRYIEQQNSAIRDVIKRLGEDIGRLEGINRGQAMMYQRAFNDWEHQRYQLQMDYGDLASRVEKLSEEILLEKRLGFAQLCILLAVLVFMGLTRGSRAETVIERPSAAVNGSVREWGRRHLRLSSDWKNGFRGSNVPTPRPRSPERDASVVQSAVLSRKKTASGRLVPPPLQLDHDERAVFPTGASARHQKENIAPSHLNTAPISFPVAGDYFQRPRTISNPRSRAPSLKSTNAGRRTQHLVQPKPITPTRASWRALSYGLQRSNSQGAAPVALGGMPHSGSWNAGVHAPKSARRWARTAHLHEVKSASLLPATARLNAAARDDEDQESRDRDMTPRGLDFDKALRRKDPKQSEDDENAQPYLTSLRKSRQSQADSEVEKAGPGGFPFPQFENTEEVLAGTKQRSSLLLQVDADALYANGNGKEIPVVDEGEGDGDPWVDTDSADNSDYDPLI